MYWPILILTFLFAAVHAGEAPRNVALVDRTVRYVNNQVLSIGDVLVRMSERMHDPANRSKPPPVGEAYISFAQDTLEQLTDEELLVQYGERFAKERKFRLVDHELIKRRVQGVAERSGGAMPLRQQAELAKRFEREQIIDIVLDSLFYARSALITEDEIAAAYQERRMQFVRPARIQALEIVFRSTDVAEQEQTAQLKLRLFKDAQEQMDAKVKLAAESRLEAFLAAQPEEQKRLLNEVMKDLAAEAEREGLDRKSAELALAARKVLERESSFRDLAAAKTQLEDLRRQLEGKGVDAFKDAARKLSQGPNAAGGGDLALEPGGWLDPGRFTPVFDEQAFACKVGTMSPVFIAETVACLVLVTGREDAQIPTLGEKRAEITRMLTDERKVESKNNAIAMLRSKASIRDIVPLAKMVE